MESSDITVEILKQIRDVLREFKEQTAVNFARVDVQLAEMNRRIDDTNHKLDRTNRHLVNVESRFVVESGALRDAVSELRDAVVDPEGTSLRERVTRCERDIAELRQR